ncbi:hypothetical protein BESB_020520 [Besnoitia besnoiti]|uniref:H/ACA ribonucleoprotein complex non-core subunit NAF1 n=1 Tax=Besnoitia besnoiti TaxID=94643 RepID=A0A2A9M731_BESBE|nr:hypothetical protein BESB_020520 [Besnoitia besnoiti]PFH32111.1 hypothetical protein BESB_020520 [Besnoitia besnoiti]
MADSGDAASAAAAGKPGAPSESLAAAPALSGQPDPTGEVEMTDGVQPASSSVPSTSPPPPAAAATASEQTPPAKAAAQVSGSASADKQEAAARVPQGETDAESSEEESDAEDAEQAAPRAKKEDSAKIRALQEALQKDLVIDGDTEIDDLLVVAHVAQIENQLLEAQRRAGSLKPDVLESLESASAENAPRGRPAPGEEEKKVGGGEMEAEDEDDDDDEPDDQEFEALMKSEQRFRQRLLPHPDSLPGVTEGLLKARNASASRSASSRASPESAAATEETKQTPGADSPEGCGPSASKEAAPAEGSGESYADKLKGLLALIGKEVDPDEEIEDDEDDDGEENPKRKDADCLASWSGIHPIEVEGLPVQVAPECAVKACGVVHAVVDAMVVIKGDENSNPLDLGSVVCLEDKTILGAVADTFGPVAAPFYVVYLARSASEAEQKGAQSPSSASPNLSARLSTGLRVFSDVAHSSFLLGEHGQVPAYLKSTHRSRLFYASGDEGSDGEEDEEDDRLSCVSGVSGRSSGSQRSARGQGRGAGPGALRRDGDGRTPVTSLKEKYEEAGKEISPEEEAALEMQKQQKEQQQKLRMEAMQKQFSFSRGDPGKNTFGSPYPSSWAARGSAAGAGGAARDQGYVVPGPPMGSGPAATGGRGGGAGSKRGRGRKGDAAHRRSAEAGHHTSCRGGEEGGTAHIVGATCADGNAVSTGIPPPPSAAGSASAFPSAPCSSSCFSHAHAQPHAGSPLPPSPGGSSALPQAAGSPSHAAGCFQLSGPPPPPSAGFHACCAHGGQTHGGCHGGCMGVSYASPAGASPFASHCAHAGCGSASHNPMAGSGCAHAPHAAGAGAPVPPPSISAVYACQGHACGGADASAGAGGNYPSSPSHLASALNSAASYAQPVATCAGQPSAIPPWTRPRCHGGSGTQAGAYPRQTPPSAHLAVYAPSSPFPSTFAPGLHSAGQGARPPPPPPPPSF